MLAQPQPATPSSRRAPHPHLHAVAVRASPWVPSTSRRQSGGARPSRLGLRCPRAQQPGWDGDLPDLQPPKFQPFTPRNALQQAMVHFRHRTNLADGDALLVAPLHADWSPAAADLLASSFADSLAASLYKRYLQRQIKAYLEAHINLPPKAVVLAALRVPRELADAAEAEALAAAAQPAAVDTALANWPSSSSMSTDTGRSTAVSRSGTSSDGGSGGGGDGNGSQATAAYDAAGSITAAAAATAGAAGALATAGSSNLLAPSSGAVLTAVLELSFSPSTRTKHLTLQSPDFRPYLCNMAVGEAHRRRGYGLALLTAAEVLVRKLGENEIYLHTRVQDKPAQLLYAKAGYEEVAADTIFVKLLGLDQRRLLRKRLQQ